MEKKQLKECPIGIQDFEKIIKNDFLYVDKTRQVYEMTQKGSQYVFLSRPRRFGKSLLASTLHYYFDGRRDLFKGLAIEQLDVQRLMSKEDWDEFYMGDDGTMTYYIDMVERKFARSSTADFDKRYDLMDSVDDMFRKIVSEN